MAPARVLAALHAAGARPAAPGEFTRRAVLNGKLDLVQAEAVGDLIDAVAPAQAQAALRQLDGGLSRRLGELREALVEPQALLGYEIDFPEEDDGPVPAGRIAGAARGRSPSGSTRLLARPASGERLREGALAGHRGRPNAGKSSLFNALLGTRPGAGHRDPGHDARRDRGAHRFSRMAGPAGRHRRAVGFGGPARPAGRRGEPALPRRRRSGAALRRGRPRAGRRRAGDRGRAAHARGAHQGRPRRAPAGRARRLRRDRRGAGRASPRGGGAGLRRADRASPTWSRALPASGTASRSPRAEDALAEALPHLAPGGDAVLAAHHVREATAALDELLGAVDVEEVLGRIFGSFCVGK